MRKVLAGLVALVVWGAGMAAEVSAEEMMPRIVGGGNHDIAKTPSMVALLNEDRMGVDGNVYESQFCGGVVIDQYWVMTAAHCVVSAQTGDINGEIQIITNTTDLALPVDKPISVERTIVYPGYSSGTLSHDIALLQLPMAEPAPVEPIALNTETMARGEQGLIVGWGALNEGSEAHPQFFVAELQAAIVNVSPFLYCPESFPGYAGLIHPYTFCGEAGGEADTCQGDSGGPLYRVNELGDAVSVAGITSWGVGCANPEYPGIYTDVAQYVEWVEATMETPRNAPVPANDGGSIAAGESAESNTKMELGGSGVMMLMAMGVITLMRKMTRRMIKQD